MKTKTVQGYLADVPTRSFVPSRILIREGRIKKIETIDKPVDDIYILPGLVDSHIHIESSMLSPQQFSRIAMKHGTVATVSDPHEIANVLGRKGIEFMVRDGNRSPVKFYFGVPSCVPATPFETAGAVLDSNIVGELLHEARFKYLAEMMNFPGVVHQDEEVMRKISLAHQVNKPIDGHAPGVRGEDLKKYASAGITTDHECHDYEEAREKIRAGMTIQIREGSAARDFDALYPLIDEYPEQVMLCSDDRHPDDLIDGHIDKLIRMGQERGLDFFNLLIAATWNPVKHYDLEVGLLREGDPADFILVDDPRKFTMLGVYIGGQQVYDSEHERTLYEPLSEDHPNVMNARELSADDFRVPARGDKIRVIHAQDNELYTSSSVEKVTPRAGYLEADTEKDMLKIAVVNRYQPQQPAVAFIRNFGLNKGALATSIAHDSHNLMAVGADDQSLQEALNQLIRQKGGIVVWDGEKAEGLPLEIAGLMTHQPGEEVARRYQELSGLARKLGCTLEAPFMTLSFMALPVIPELKITDKGLFDVTRFEHTGLFAGE
ncbi:MAG: adenine deaminase [Bacteroidales bacterium]|nr:adenine deaminase [Bacteroidales bacterium]